VQTRFLLADCFTVDAAGVVGARRVWQSLSVIPLGVFLFGLVVGSFLNVCILRIPADKSIVLPASSCPKCGKAIAPYDNIPVLSWLILGGKCRNCKTKISIMYPAVELLTGLLFLACYFAFGLSVDALKWATFSALLIVLTITDLRERILPDSVNFFGVGAGLLFSFFTSPMDGTASWIANRWFDFPPPQPALSFADAVLGAAVGGGLLWGFERGYFLLTRRVGMGLGDVKMMAMVGVFLGVKRTFLTIIVGSLVGSVIGILNIACLYLFGYKKHVAIRAARRSIGTENSIRFVLAKRYQLPFGTYLGIGGLATLFFGSPLVQWYQTLLAVR
jgi:leader peptidase (prepilin peptidase)/N-methyltransferase